MNNSSSTGFFLFCSLGVFFSYLVYGILQEKITQTRYGTNKEQFSYFFILLFFQCIINAIFARIALCFISEKGANVQEVKYALCGFTYIGAMFTSNFSLKFVSYPAQVIGKSVKPISVMILSVILARRRYPIHKYIFVLMITIGVALFMYKGSLSKSSESSFGFGELLLIVSLAFDGFTGGIQDGMRKHNVGSYTLMFHMNAWSVLYTFLGVLFSNEALSFFSFVLHYPPILVDMLLFGLTSAIGQMFVFSLITHFSPLTCSIVTTTRKFFTVLASVLFFGHVMTSRQWLGTLLVFAGLFLDHLYGKTKVLKSK